MARQAEAEQLGAAVAQQAAAQAAQQAAAVVVRQAAVVVVVRQAGAEPAPVAQRAAQDAAVEAVWAARASTSDDGDRKSR